MFAPASLKVYFIPWRLIKGTLPQELCRITSKDQILNDRLVSALIIT